MIEGCCYFKPQTTHLSQTILQIAFLKTKSGFTSALGTIKLKSKLISLK
jgi:hypothetical protein